MPALRRNPSAITWLVMALIAIGASGIFLDRAWLGSARPPVDLVGWLGLLVAFLLAETFVVHLEVGENAHSFSLTETPLVVGLLLFPASQLIAARLLAGLAIVGWSNRRQLIKLVFNLSLFLTELGVVLVVFHAAHAALGEGQAARWIAAVVATFVVNAVAAVAVSMVISLAGGEPDHLGTVISLGAVSTFGTTVLGLLIVDTIEHDPAGLWMVAGLAGVLFIAYRQYGSLQRRYTVLHQLHEFTRVLAGSPELTTTIHNSLEQARVVLRANRAELTLVGEDLGGTRMRLVIAGDNDLQTEVLHDADEDPLVARVARDAEPILLPRHARMDDLQALLDARGAKDLVACPLLANGTVLGVMAVMDHRGEVSTFTEDDLRVFETLANHVTVSLENARLIDQLRVEAAEKQHQAMHDSLTGLGNRALFQEATVATLAAARDTGDQVAVMVMDLNRFKDVNDTLGHHTGDLLLRQAAERLRAVMPSHGFIARLGGDEFVLVLPRISTEAEAIKVAADAQANLARPFEIGGMSIGVGAAVGIAIAPQHGEDPGTLLRRADIAMYVAKEEGDLDPRVFCEEYAESGARLLGLGGDLRHAVEVGAIDLHYQPLAEILTNRIVSAEALLRWKHPEHGFVSPEEVVRLAERLGLIRPLTNLVMLSAAQQCRSWCDQGLDLTVAVNLSAQSLADQQLYDDVHATLVESGLEPERLILEITETQVIRDPNQTIAVLSRIRDLGVQLAIDDFGTGFSSLSYLTRLPAGEVKIDKSFVQQMLTDPTCRKVVQSVIDLGNNLGLTVVAEGVEDLLTLDALQTLGCDLVQGYHLSRPLPADQLTPWLHSRARLRAAHPA